MWFKYYDLNYQLDCCNKVVTTICKCGDKFASLEL